MDTTVNIIGRQYGSILITDSAILDQSGQCLVSWKCLKCQDAGFRSLDDLENGLESICFCNNFYKRTQDYGELIGRTFHELTILDVIRIKNSEPICMVKCSCGTLCKVRLSQVYRGEVKSCGHVKSLTISSRNKDSLIGMKINHLTILSTYIDPLTKRHRAICSCDCGQFKDMRLDGILSGHATSCGCYNRMRTISANSNIRKLNRYEIISDNVAKVYFNTNDNFFHIDLSAWEYLKWLTWHLLATGYAATRPKGKTIMLHHLLIDCPKGYVRDHIDRNKLNNCYNNLRVVKPVVNFHNCDRFEVSGEKYLEKDPNFVQHNTVLTESLTLENGKLNPKFPYYKYENFIPWESIGISIGRENEYDLLHR